MWKFIARFRRAVSSKQPAKASSSPAEGTELLEERCWREIESILRSGTYLRYYYFANYFALAYGEGKAPETHFVWTPNIINERAAELRRKRVRVAYKIDSRDLGATIRLRTQAVYRDELAIRVSFDAESQAFLISQRLASGNPGPQFKASTLKEAFDQLVERRS